MKKKAMAPATTIKCKLYPSASDGFVGKLEVPADLEPSTSSAGTPAAKINSTLAKTKTTISLAAEVETIVILDQSGSMGQNVQRIIERVLPEFFTQLGYQPTDTVTLITFESETCVYAPTVKDLETLGLRAAGGTQMQAAVSKLGELISTKQPEKLRILTISDGELADQEQTVAAAAQLATRLEQMDILVNSKAIRLFTSSYGHPDTRGLASILQLNTMDSVGESILLDVDATSTDPAIMVTEFVSLFQQDGLDGALTLRVDGGELLASPWNPKPVESVHLLKGTNTIWLKSVPKSLTLDDCPGVQIELELCDRLSLANLQAVLQTKTDHFFGRLKLLKVVNTPESRAEVQLMTDYFARLHQFVAASEAGLLSSEPEPTQSLKGRLAYLRSTVQKRFAGVFNELAQIANDSRVAEMNAAQQATYLREMDTSRNARALARRAQNQGLDFTATLRQEVRQMQRHLHELQDIDDQEHLASFCCLETTLGGIRATATLAEQEELLDALEATDILQMINIVGIPCHGPVGDFPDPMTWRVDRIFCGSYVSLSDVLMQQLMGGGQPLKVPGAGPSDPEISNVIPLFDDPRIQRFLRKHAPSLLEYTCSVGMRRVISGVPLTYAYTVCAGLWKMVEVLNTDKSERNLKAFVNLTHTYEVAIGRYFQHVTDLLKHQELVDESGQQLGYYIANNGITNMISPMLSLAKANSLQFMPQILRSIYAFEVYQAVKRSFKGVEQADVAATQKLNKLLGVDYDRHGTSVGPLFETVENPVFYDQYHVDDALLEEMSKGFWYVDFCSLLPVFLSAVYGPTNPEDALRGVPQMSESSICSALGISCSLKTFKLYNIVQAILFNSKALRVDDDAKKMKIVDLGLQEQAEALLRGHVRKQYAEKYRQELAAKDAQEKTELARLFAEQAVQAATVEQFSKLLLSGLSHKKRQFQVPNGHSYGFEELRLGLLDLEREVPLRLEKLSALVLGRDSQGAAVFNNGQVLRLKLGHYKAVFEKLGQLQRWESIVEAYRANNTHTYRGGEDMKNRHGHSNDKASYWAMGFQTLAEFSAAISAEEWKAYQELHFDCCGVDQLMPEV